MTPQEIYENLYELFPDAQCELIHQNAFEMAIAVLLSAQTTDKSVNKVTPALFARYPNAKALSEADVTEVEGILHSLGLYRNKARNIIRLANELLENFNGEMPHTREKLMTLSGIGRKSANVILIECFDTPAIPVDTHVERVCKRLKLAKEADSVLDVERKLARKYPKEQWRKMHHMLIFFGRYRCKSQHPLCEGCPFAAFCRYQKEKGK